jgi:uncharacterized cupin superfamily protein
MPDEAQLIETQSGLEPGGEGWFVVNVRDAAWWRQRDAFGFGCRFENPESEPTRFPQLGFNLRVLQPGEPNCRYHAESDQEGFLVLAGECLLLVEGQERRLEAWDFVHCPPGTEHVFVGAGNGPSVILMVGARLPEGEIRYPVSDLALAHVAGVEQEATDPREAYADLGPNRRERLPELGLPWQRARED